MESAGDGAHAVPESKDNRDGHGEATGSVAVAAYSPGPLGQTSGGLAA